MILSVPPLQGGGIGVCRGGLLRGSPDCRQQRGVPAHGGGDGCDRDCILVVVGSGDNNNHPGIAFAVTASRTTMITMSLLGSWQGPDDRNDVAAPVVNGGNFLVWAFTILTSSRQRGGELFWLYY